MTIAPTAIGTFRDKRGRFWVNVEVICDFIGASLPAERRKIKSLNVFHPHLFMRHRKSPDGSRRRYYIYSLPASELLRWLATFADVPAYKCPVSGTRYTVDRKRISHIRRSTRELRALVRVHEIEQALSA